MALKPENLFCIYNEKNDVFLAIHWIWIDSRFGLEETVKNQFNKSINDYTENGFTLYSLQDLFNIKDRDNNMPIAIRELYEFIENYNKRKPKVKFD